MEAYTPIPIPTFQEELISASESDCHATIRDSDNGRAVLYLWLEDDRVRLRHPLGDYEVDVTSYTLKLDRFYAEGCVGEQNFAITLKRHKDGVIRGTVKRDTYKPCTVHLKKDEFSKTVLVEPFLMYDSDVYVGCRLFSGTWCTFEGYTQTGLCILRGKSRTTCVPVTQCRKHVTCKSESKLKYLKRRESTLSDELERIRFLIAQMELS